MKKRYSYPLLGAHMSIAGGLYKAIERGESIECTAIQIFTKSNRQWDAKDLTKEEVDLFLDTWQTSQVIDTVVAHASYLINIGSPKEDIEKKSVQALLLELKRTEILQIPYLIIHPGAHLKMGEQDCINRIAKNIDLVLESATGKTKILLENMAGQGSNVGYTFEQLAAIRAKISHKKLVGICFDTCHAWSAGHKFDTPKTYNNMWEYFDNLIGLSNLGVIHLNDSKYPLNSSRDRHAHIGKGTIDIEAFRLIINDQRFKDVPKILETPKESIEDDKKNLDVIRSLI